MKRARWMVAGLFAVLSWLPLNGQARELPLSVAHLTRLFRGAWFDVRYPATFKARAYPPHKPKDEVNSAFFTSPDGAVEFYVFSPLWNGNPREIALNPKCEILVSRQVQRRRTPGMVFYGVRLTRDGKKVPAMRRESIERLHVVWTTARARNRSYTRSWLDVTRPDLNTRYVFGIKYRNWAAYKRYNTDYEAFKHSLRQYSD